MRKKSKNSDESGSNGEPIIPRRAFLIGATAVGLGTAAVPAIQADSRDTGVDPHFLKELQERPPLGDNITDLMQQIINNPVSRYPLTALLSALPWGKGTLSQKPTGTVLFDDIDDGLGFNSLIPSDNNAPPIKLGSLGYAYNNNTSLKMDILFEEKSQTLMLLFGGTNLSTQNLEEIAATIITNAPVPTRSQVAEYINALKPALQNGVTWNHNPELEDPFGGSTENKAIHTKIKNCVIVGNSLGAGSAVYALDTIMKDEEIKSVIGIPKTLLIEPWKAHAAAQATGSDINELAKHITEIRCYPGTLINDGDNPVIGKKAALLVPTPDYTDKTTGVKSRIKFHDFAFEYNGLYNGNIRLVDSTPRELANLRAPIVDRVAEKTLKNTPFIGTAAAVGTAATFLAFFRRRNALAQARMEDNGTNVAWSERPEVKGPLPEASNPTPPVKSR